MKAGYKTTEFWLSAVIGLLGIAGVLGFLSPDDVSTLKGAVTQAVSSITTILVVIRYNAGRAAVKTAAIAKGIAA